MPSATRDQRPFVIVLTGGVAAGKTAVSDRFAKLGVPVIDTDVIAREVVQAGQPALTRIVDEFGTQVLDESAQLDRRLMRRIIMDDPASRDKLERILHPAIGKEVERRIASVGDPYCLLVVPLLVETGRYQWADRVLLVDVDEATQVERLIRRDRVSPDQARAMLKAQASRQERLAAADDIIVNSGSPEDLDTAVAGLHRKYRQMAAGFRDNPGDSAPEG